jgi:hypothetical protein
MYDTHLKIYKLNSGKEMAKKLVEIESKFVWKIRCVYY